MTTVVTETGSKGLLLWLRANQPRLYSEFLKIWNTNAISGLGAVGDPFDPANYPATPTDPATTTSTAPTSSGFADLLSNVIKSAASIFLTKAQVDAQGKLLDAQLARAKAGLPPLNIDPANYGLQTTVGVGLAPATKQLLMYGGIAAGALWLLSMFARRRS